MEGRGNGKERGKGGLTDLAVNVGGAHGIGQTGRLIKSGDEMEIRLDRDSVRIDGLTRVDSGRGMQHPMSLPEIVGRGTGAAGSWRDQSPSSGVVGFVQGSGNSSGETEAGASEIQEEEGEEDVAEME